MNKGINRRDFFKVAAASGAAAAVAGCGTDPVEEVLPMLVPPTEYVPGTSISFSTTCNECSANCGMVVRTREGRAIKAEGHENNPLNQGSLCAIGQSSMQGMYAPTRAQGPASVSGGKRSPVSWADGLAHLKKELQGAAGKILYIGKPQSGSMVKLKEQFLKAFGGGTALSFEISAANNIKAANKLCFGREEVPQYDIASAKTLISFGADFLESWLNPMEATKGYTKMHAYKGGEKGRFFYVGPHMTLTGTNADKWVSCRAGAEAQVALSVANEIGAGGKLGDFLKNYDKATVAKNCGVEESAIVEMAKAFAKNGKSIAIAGGSGDNSDLQVAVNILNEVAGNINSTVRFGAEYQIGGDSLKTILAALKAGPKVVILENANLVYALPKEAGVAEALKNAFVVSLSTEIDEGAELANLHLPTSHYMESWGDAAPRNGVRTLQQPVMAKLPGYDTMGLGDLLVELSGNAAGDYKSFVEQEWKGQGDFRKNLQQGGVYGDFKQANVSFNDRATRIQPAAGNAKGLVLAAANSTLHNANGTGGNRTWLMEVAHPVTQLVWDSWIEVHPDTAVELGINHGELVEVTTSKGKQEVGVWVFYGIERNTVSMPTGRGRMVPLPTYVSTRGKSIFLPHVEMADDVTIKNQKVGENVTDLMEFKQDQLTGELLLSGTEVTIKGTGKDAWLVSPEGQARDDIEGLNSAYKAGMGDRSQKDRGFVQTTTPDVLSGHAEPEHHGHHLKKRHYVTDLPNNTDFYKERSADIADHVAWAGKEKPKYYDPYKWEMNIDLDRCTGCSACVVACYAENNIPVVGKERMWTGREMNWIRIERYIDFNKETNSHETYYTPEMCNQCENAGCEPVCPVYATYHNDEGINAMVYNRCVGTRYCSNNCIYKQRRFNWRQYEFPSPLHMQLNPAITVREKGVMEKCNFCYSRVREAKDLAKDLGGEVKDGAVKTACQQTCGADAITFGNIKDENSLVKKINTTSKRAYKQLEEVNYKPSITYLKKVKHDNRKA